MYILNPLEQFELYNVIGRITNLGIFLIISIIIIIIGIKINSEEKIIIKRENIIKESLTSTVIEVVREQIGKQENYPIILTIFMFILFSNILGMIPYSFTPTSHIIITIGLSLPIMIGVTIIGIKKYKEEFLAIFLPVNTPTWLIPLLTTIELISYIARAFSLGIRLFSNIVAGHSLLHIVAGFAYKYATSKGIIILKLIPILLISILMGLEIIIAFLQAYVFTVITASYIKDVL